MGTLPELSKIKHYIALDEFEKVITKRACLLAQLRQGKIDYQTWLTETRTACVLVENALTCIAQTPEELEKGIVARWHEKDTESLKREITHEADHARLAGIFYTNHGFPEPKIKYGAVNGIKKGMPAYIPCVWIEHLEEFINTRELVIEYFQFMLENVTDPSPDDKELLGES